MINSAADNYAEQTAFFAHEIKNPLAVIKANVQLIELDNGGENKKSFEAVYEQIDKINRLIQENMDLIKMSESNKCDIIRIIDKAVNTYSANSREFKIKYKDQKVNVDCKTELLESLFGNLIKNAVEATVDGGLIEIEIKRKGKRVAVSIADNGCGISEKDLERIGELFYTTKKEGSGVGIFMCKRIVEQNGGKFKIAHNKPKGTKVTVELNTDS